MPPPVACIRAEVQPVRRPHRRHRDSAAPKGHDRTGRMLRFVLPALAFAGIAYAIYYTAVLARREPPVASQLALPERSKYRAVSPLSVRIRCSRPPEYCCKYRP